MSEGAAFVALIVSGTAGRRGLIMGRLWKIHLEAVRRVAWDG